MVFITSIHVILFVALLQLQQFGVFGYTPDPSKIYITTYFDLTWTGTVHFSCGSDQSKDRTKAITTQPTLTCEATQRMVLSSSVHKLQVGGCFFPTLPAGLLSQFTSLRKLTIVGSGLIALRVQDLPPNHSRLTSLQLKFNEISTIDVDLLKALSNLKELDLGNNKIVAVTTELLNAPNLEMVNLDANSNITISEDAFAGLTQLTELSLSSVRLVTFPFKFNSGNNLRKLDLSVNDFTALQHGYFRHLKKLEELSLALCLKLEKIELGAFAPLLSLEELDLSTNHLKAIDFDVFLPSMPGLESLRLSNNRLSELTTSVDRLFPRLQKLSVGRNQFNCTYLKTFLRTVRTRSRAIDVNMEWDKSPNVGGIQCIDAPEEPVAEVGTIARGFKSGYNASIFVLLLFIGLANLAICAAIAVAARRFSSSRN